MPLTDPERPRVFDDEIVPSAHDMLNPQQEEEEATPIPLGQKTGAQLRVENLERIENRPTGQTLNAAFESFNPTRNFISGIMERARGAELFDEKFLLTGDMLAEAQDRLGVTDASEQLELNDYLSESFSQAEFEERIGRYQHSREAMAQVFEGGIGGGILALAAAYMIDPTVFIAPGMSRVAPIARALQSTVRAKRAMGGGVAVGTEAVVAETAVALGNPLVDEDDIMIALLLGGGIGAGLGGGMKKLLSKSEVYKRQQKVAAQRESIWEQAETGVKKDKPAPTAAADNGLPDEFPDIEELRRELEVEADEVLATSKAKDGAAPEANAGPKVTVEASASGSRTLDNLLGVVDDTTPYKVLREITDELKITSTHGVRSKVTARAAIKAHLEKTKPSHGAGGAAAVAPGTAETPPVGPVNILNDLVSGHEGTVPTAREASLNIFGMKIVIPRFDPLRRLTGSASEKLRALGMALWDDRLGFKGGQKLTAKETAHRYFSQLANPLLRSIDANGRAWAKSRGIRWNLNIEAQDNFFNEVTKAVRANVPEGLEPAIAQAARDWQKTYITELKLMKRLGMIDDAVPEDPTFVPRILDDNKFQANLERFGAQGATKEFDGGLLKVVHQAILKGQPDIEPKLARVLARGWLKMHRKRHIGMDANFAYGINLADVKFAREIIEEGLRGIGKTHQEIGEIQHLVDVMMQRVTKRATQQGKIGTAKMRIKMDEVHKVDLKIQTGPETGQVVQLSLQDLLRGNAHNIALTQLRRVAGHAALKQKLGKSMTGGQMSDFLDEVRIEADGLSLERAEVDAIVEATEIMMREILSMPVADMKGANSKLNRFGRAVRKFNTITTMNMSGFASFVEFAFPMQRGAIAMLTEALPAYRQFIRDAKTGKISNEVMDFLDIYSGEGAEDLLRPTVSRIDDPDDAIIGLSLDSKVGFGSKVEQLLQKGSHITLEYLAGLLPMTRMQKRLTGAMQLHEFATIAGDSRKFLARVDELGLSPAQAKAALRGAKKANTTIQRIRREGKATALDLQKLRETDPEAFEAIMLGVQRAQDRAVISATGADIPPMFRKTEIGKILAQFQGFAMTSYTQHFLSPISRGDLGQFYAVLQSMMLATMAYTVQQVALNAGNPKKLKERLSLDRIALNSIARTSHASILPMLTDTASGIVFGKPLFNATVSGRPSDAIRGIPTLRTLDAAANLGGGILQGNFTQNTARAAKTLTPFGNAIPVGGILNAIVDKAPKRSE